MLIQMSEEQNRALKILLSKADVKGGEWQVIGGLFHVLNTPVDGLYEKKKQKKEETK